MPFMTKDEHATAHALEVGDLAVTPAEFARLRKERDELREALIPFVETYSAVDVVHGLNSSARAKLQRAQKALANLNKPASGE